MKPNKGWFSIVQYCPDPNRLESANIGVLLFCPGLNFLDVRIARDNKRITKFFGSKGLDLTLVNSFKKGLRERLRKEQERIVDHVQLVDFVDRRANQVRISSPRSIRVMSPKKQLDELFANLVGESPTSEVSVKRLLAESLEQPVLQPKLFKSIAIKVPIDNRELEVPYAFRNGRFNLIQPVSFRADNPLQTAYRYAVEGDSIYQTEHDEFGKLRLLVVGGFRDRSDENKQIVNRILRGHHVSLYTLDEVATLVDEILETGKDRSDDPD